MKKITRYEYNGSKEEKELQELRETYTEINQTEYCKENNIYPSIQWLNSINQKIEELEKFKNHLKEFKNIGESQESLYEVWYYCEPDIYNNGGTKTVLKRDQLNHLIKRGNELTNIYFLSIYDINESFKKGKLVKPDFLSEEIKKQLNNPDYNNWHSSLLGDK